MQKIKNAQSGSILIVLIITMVIMGTLGTSMYLLTTTGTFGSLFSNKANRALLLAESGIRYAQKDVSPTLSLSPIVNGTDQIIINKTLAAGVTTIISTGIADYNSIWPVRRKITFDSGSSGGAGGGAGPPPEQFGAGWTPGTSNFDTSQIGTTDEYRGSDPGDTTGRFRIIDSAACVSDVGLVDRFYLVLDSAKYNFSNAWTAQGSSLSYDTQVKIKNTSPDNKFMAGLSFRVSPVSGEDYMFLGVSFAQGDETAMNIVGLPPYLPTYSDPYVILWRNTSMGDFRMIAYKKLTTADGITTAPVFSDDMESGSAKWTPSASGTPGWSLSSNGTGNDYWTGTVRRNTTPKNIFLATTNAFSISSSSTILSFSDRWSNIGSTETLYVEMSTDGGSSYPTVLAQWNDRGTNNSFQTESISISTGLPSSTVKIRFRLLTTGTSGSTNRTWTIDDVRVGPPPFVAWSTLLARLTDKSTAPSGSNLPTGPGQRVNEIEVFFGTPTANGTGGTTTPIDINRLANLRDQLSWPPASPINTWSSTTDDKFTLASADTSDANANSNPWYWADGTRANLTNYYPDPVLHRYGSTEHCRYELASGGSQEPYAVIRTNCFTTQNFTASSFNNRPEAGLHAFGNSIVGNVCFDDWDLNLGGSGGGTPSAGYYTY